MTEHSVARSALAAGPALLRKRPTRKRERPAETPEAETAPVSEPPSSVQAADPGRVFARVRDLLLLNVTPSGVGTAISSILRDTQFAAAWNNANASILADTKFDELLKPVVDESLSTKIGRYRDEIQTTADAWASVVGQVLGHDAPVKPEIAAEAARYKLPNYLDDDGLPIEVREALRSRDAAAVCYMALVMGTEDSVRADVLATYAELHCLHQRRWLDLLSWMYGLDSPSIVPIGERQDWAQIYAEWQDVQQGVDALFEHSVHHPNGFAVGELSIIPE